LKREKFPNWGLIWRENMGFRELGLGFADEEKRLNLALNTRGELWGHPNTPIPDLREIEKGKVPEGVGKVGW